MQVAGLTTLVVLWSWPPQVVDKAILLPSAIPSDRQDDYTDLSSLGGVF